MSADEQPLRSELFSVVQLERHAKSMAGSHMVAPAGRPWRRHDRLLPRLAENEVVLRDAYEVIADAVKRGRRITPASEWFLDNFHLIEDQVRTARRHLPRGYSRQLPQLSSGPSARYPRVYDIALELISHVDGRIDAESVRAFIASYESVSPLMLGELWAIPIMLRLALLENLRRVATRLASGRRDRERAQYWVERMLDTAAKDPARVVLVLADMVREDPPLTTAFAAEFATQLQGHSSTLVFPMTWLEQRLSEQGETIEQVYRGASQNQAADQVSVGNSITSLRFLGTTEWRDFVESMSTVEHTLLTDPAGVYGAMDFGTRDNYRHAVEEIARRSTQSEDDVARKAVELASARMARSAKPEAGGNGAEAADREGHVGYFLIDRGRRELELAVHARRTVREWICRVAGAAPLMFYVGSIALITAVVTGLVLWWCARSGVGVWGMIGFGALIAICASHLAVALSHWGATILVQPRILPRLDFSKGIPPADRTIVVVPTILSEPADIDQMVEALELRYLANRDDSLYFALLTDFRDAPQEQMPEDEVLLNRARDGITALNAKYSRAPAGGNGDEDSHAHDSFFLLHRSRRWNESEGVWMGWERKRGKLEDLNAVLRGATGKFDTVVGSIDQLEGLKFVITLDSDTQLPRDSARQLVGTMAHPLNRPIFDPQRGIVTAGYSILQPRLGISIPSTNRSRFARLFAGEPGIDPYTRAVSDAYQDIFGEGSFTGKGIYDIDAFGKALGGRLPENRILSHDLLESAYARSGLVSDVTLFEDYPTAYPVDVSRRHRWMRGDWQILPWLGRHVPGPSGKSEANPIFALSWWKIFDNLRRSVVPPALLAALIAGWFLPGGAFFYSGIIIAILILPPMLSGLSDLARRQEDLPIHQHIRFVGRGAGRQILQVIFVLACLPYEAYISAEAIGRTAVRMWLTGRKLLEWRTAVDAERTARTDFAGFYVSMWIQAAVAILSIAAVVWLRPGSIPAAAPLVAMWLISPGIAWWLSKPLRPQAAKFSAEDTTFLLAVARRTWRFFETFVVASENFLPPDNFQEDPPVGIAHRTSPTNIGLALLSNLAALDFGFIPAAQALERTTQTLATLDKMPRHRGHFYNWYDTRTLEALRPLYVSTVDSGNLAGHLLTLAAGFGEMGSRPIFNRAEFSGLEATLNVLAEAHKASKTTGSAGEIFAPLREALRSPARTLSAVHQVLLRVTNLGGEFERSMRIPDNSELKWWIQAFVRQCRQFADELNTLAPWVELPPPSELIWREGKGETVVHLAELRQLLLRLDEIPTLAEAARLESELLPAIDAVTQKLANVQSAQQWLQQLRAAVLESAEHSAKRLADVEQLAMRCREMADVDYSFLYDESRRLMAIGFDVGERRRDPGYYDLLASEARLTSYVAIAQGKVPQEHWFALGRLLTSSGGRTALLSWSGSMFEYLMPLLVMPTYQHTLLDETCRAVVQRQIEFGRERGVPWGISESGYNKTDAQLNYQYRAFGVPGLGFRRGLADDLVIAPYASVMAIMVNPKASCANLRRLASDGYMGMYGYYEAVDFTPARLPPDRTSVVVRSFMAHHQGMSFISLLRVLGDGPMQRRFESDPEMRATDLLLHERVPKTPAIYPHPAEVSEARGAPAEAAANIRTYTTANTPVPEVHLLSNGQYHVVVTAAGGGYSRWRDLAVTRWHEDTTRDCWGTFCYLRDVESGDFWSVAFQPTLKRASSYEAIYSQGRAEYRRRDRDIDTHVEISVSPEDNIELRRIAITNRGNRPRTIELTSYAEVVLANPQADASHPAFSNLFVQTQIVRHRQAILCTRRPRSAPERPPWMLHLMTVHGTAVGRESYETGREEFIGRGRTLVDPAAMHRATLSDSEGSVLDPIVAIRSTVMIAPDETVRVNLVTGVAETQEAAMGLIERYHDRHLADRVFELAWTHSQVILRQLDASEADTQLYSRLASSILYMNPLMRAPPSVIARNRRGQSGLWGYSISGDLPIVLLRVSDLTQINLVRQMVAAHAYWRVKGLSVDLVIWNEDQSGYRQALQDAIMGVIGSRAESSLVDKPGGIFVRRIEQMSDEDKVLIQTVARIIISDTAGTLAEQVERRPRAEAIVPRFTPVRPRQSEVPVGVEVVRRDLAAFNGIGGFTKDGREYVITTTPDLPTPAPWANVIANPYFGMVVTESGGTYTWCENAQSYRLTPWYNDWILDASGEAFYIRDEESGRFWSPSPLPARGVMPYTTRHGFGYSIFEYAEGGISSETTTYVATDAPVKFVVIKLHNASGRARRVSITAFLELVLGERRGVNAPYVFTEVDTKTGALFARNSYSGEFAARIAFLDCSEAQRTVTGDRTEFLGRNGVLGRPACMSRTRLSGRAGASLDPCAAMQIMVDLPDGRDREVAFIIGSGQDVTDARNLVGRFRGMDPARDALAKVWDFWNRTLGTVHVETPDTSLNFLANGWLLYQTLACRFFGRSGFYQSGGAFGFRDQLQDVCALTHADPTILRAHLLRCASRQFREGDVQHWWHTPSGRGVRTRMSDDYLWLPYATCRYIAALGDTGVLDEKAYFLEGRAVKPDEDSYFDFPTRSEESASLYEHCVRAIKNGLKFGEHGLPLMGTGDWNDGMNLVGEHGKGESVWLAFFLYEVLEEFRKIAELRKDTPFAELCASEAARLKANIEQNAWDGQWYRRAYFDNGEPLGSASNDECQIDSIPQSWSVISAAAPAARAKQALEAVDQRLVRRDLAVIQLFDPPFDKSHLNPGYIKGYVPGVRENGGQYTHAAVWAVIGFAEFGNIEKAWELFNLINPVNHGDNEAKIAQYKVEPYVVAADVYTNPNHAGRGGWTWYTGSAGWMYRLVIESLLGLRLQVDRLHLAPRIPKDWESFKIHYRYRETFHHIQIQNRGGTTVRRVVLDGVEQPDKSIPLVDDRRDHQIEVELGAPVESPA